MNLELFPQTSDKLPENCVIGWLVNSDIKDKAIEGITQNLLDFYSFKYRKIPQVASHDLVELCNLGLQAGHKKILIFKQGIVLDDFIENTKEYWNNEYKDSVLIGNDLHTLYIDLIWWEEAGKPNSYIELFNIAMEQKKKVSIWDIMLTGKGYINGYEETYRISFDLWKTRWYAANTEDMGTKISNEITCSVYSTSGGLSPIVNAYLNNLKGFGQLVCFDIQPLALHMQRYIFENWNGRDWKDLITKYMKENPMLGRQFTCTERLDEMDEYIQTLGKPFQVWWNSIAKTFNIDYLEIDIMNFPAMKKDLESSRDYSNDGEKVLIDVSNAFNFEINSILYSKDTRIQVEADYLNYFKEHKDKFITKGFDLGIINNDKSFPFLPKLFPWQQF